MCVKLNNQKVEANFIGFPQKQINLPFSQS